MNTCNLYGIDPILKRTSDALDSILRTVIGFYRVLIGFYCTMVLYSLTPALGKTIADVLFDDLVIYLVTDAKSVISMVPALFWVRPCIESDCESLTDCRPIW